MALPEPNVFSQKWGSGVVGAAASIVTSTGIELALCARASGAKVIVVARMAVSARSLLMSVAPVTGTPAVARCSGAVADVQQNELVWLRVKVESAVMQRELFWRSQGRRGIHLLHLCACW